MILTIVIGAVCAGIAFMTYCCCRVAGEADARLEALEERFWEDESGDTG